MRRIVATLIISTLLAFGGGAAWALEITSISPEPLVSGGMGQLAGGPFDEADLVVSLDDQAQALEVVQWDQVLFTVSSELPLGAATLRVETGGDAVEIDVEISAPPPTIGSVSPQPVIMGQPATILGTDLAGVVAVRLGGVLCEVTAQTDFQLAFVVPMAPEAMGTATLLLETASWSSQAEIQVKAPTPSIDSLSPNPVRQGDLLTIQGTIVPINLAVTIGDQDAAIFASSTHQVVVQVPETLPPGAVDVWVHLGDVTSEASGPLHVQEGSSKRPDIDRVAPSNLTYGGSVWLFGDEMAEVDWASDGLWVGDCDDKACRVTPEDPELGQLQGAVGSPEGIDVFTVTVLADTLVVPEILSVEPNPAFRGEQLTLHGANLHQVNTAYVGGVEQVVDHVDVGIVQLFLDPSTPMGSERVMVAGGSGSNALSVIVLDPLPGGDDGATQDADVAVDTADSDTTDSDASTVDLLMADTAVEPGAGTSSGSGCGGAPASTHLAPLLLLLLVPWRRRS